MKFFTALWVATLLVVPSWAQSFSIEPGETVEEFALRNGPANARIVHKVVETKGWGGPKKSIIVFYEYEVEENSGETGIQLEGFVFAPSGGSSYRRLEIDAYEPSSRGTEVTAVFFELINGQRKLVVMCASPFRNYDCGGTIYKTYIYNPPPPKGGDLQLDRRLTKIFEFEADLIFRDGRVTKARFKTAAEVRRMLKKLNNASK
jgi:hypothetical protein